MASDRHRFLVSFLEWLGLMLTVLVRAEEIDR